MFKSKGNKNAHTNNIKSKNRKNRRKEKAAWGVLVDQNDFYREQ